MKDELRLLHGGDYNPDQWLDYPDILQKDLELMKEAKVNTVTVGIFAWSTLEPKEGEFHFEWLDKIFDDVYQMGGNVILATPSGARPAWMSQKYPEVLRTNDCREKMLHGGRHNHCFSSKVYREKVALIDEKLAQRYGNHPALLMWHVSNEFSGECHCEYCQENFRTWLKKKYGTIEELNKAWWGPFWSHSFSDWSQVESPSPLGETMVHGLNLDWRRFVTDQTIDFYQHEVASINKYSKDTPITTNFMADTDNLIPFQSLDYGKFADAVDVLSWDCYPAWHNDWGTTADLASKVGFINDLYRSLKQKSFMIMESTPSGVNWHKVNKTKRPGMHQLASMQFIAHGSDSNLYFQWRKSRGSSEKFHGAVVDHDNSDKNRVFQDVALVGAALEKIASVKGTYKKAKVAILYDWENNWAFNDCQGFSQATKQYPETLQAHYRYFWNHDIPVEVVTPQHDLAKYDLVVAPMLYLITEETMTKLKNYVENGGHLVSSYLTGYVNENDLTYLNGWPQKLQDIFGLKVTETDTYYPTDFNEIVMKGKTYRTKDYDAILELATAQSLADYQRDFYQGQPAVTRNVCGKGMGYFIGPRTNLDFLTDFYQDIVDELGLNNGLVVRGNPDVSIQARDGKDQSYYFVMNFSEENQEVELAKESYDLLSDTNCPTQITLKPYEVKVLTVEG